MNKHIILIGFKNVGKSVIGKALSKSLRKNFIDLDEELKTAHQKATDEKLTTRQIIKKHGEPYFRQLEHETLVKILKQSQSSVIALGGGAPMQMESRPLILKHTVIHISAPKGIVYERIMINGRPAIFPDDESPLQAFKRLWTKRSKVYEELAQAKVENSFSVDDAVVKIISILKKQ